MAAKPYNGHHCWNCWNVALWLGNDEGLYNAAMHYINWQRAKPLRTFRTAARLFITTYGLDRTPDGAKYTNKAVTSALIGLAD